MFERAAAVRCMQIARHCECLADALLLICAATGALMMFLATLLPLSNSMLIIINYVNNAPGIGNPIKPSSRSLDLHLFRAALEVLEPVEVAADLRLLQNGEMPVFAHKCDLHAVRLDLALVARALPERRQTVEDQLVESGSGELSQVVLEVGPRRLRPRPDGVGLIFIVISTGAGLEEVRAVLVDARNEQSHSVGSFGGVLGLDLRFCVAGWLLSAILKMSLLRGWLEP